MPAHTHNLLAVGGIADVKALSPATLLPFLRMAIFMQPRVSHAGKTIAQVTLAATGREPLPHNNAMPYLTVNFCIALQGSFPAKRLRKDPEQTLCIFFLIIDEIRAYRSTP